MKFTFLIILFSLSTPLFSSEKILGEFSTVSESECNSEIHFFKNGKGIFVDSCRKDDGSHINTIDKQNISWQLNNNKILVKINGLDETFTYHSQLSCSPFGKRGNANGLVGFDLYFWKKPIKCK